MWPTKNTPLPSEVYAVVHHERGVATVRGVKDKKRIQAAILGLACMLGSDLSDLVRRCRTTVKGNRIPFPPRLYDYARCGTTGNAPIVA